MSNKLVYFNIILYRHMYVNTIIVIININDTIIKQNSFKIVKLNRIKYYIETTQSSNQDG